MATWPQRAPRPVSPAPYTPLVRARIVGIGAARDVAIGALALAANVGVALLLYRYRTGDANMRSVWICSRNDAIGNVAVMMAALGVFGTGSAWPDLMVAAIMAGLALTGGVQVFRQASAELRTVAS